MPKDDFNKLTTMLENFSPSTLKTGDTLLRTIFLLNAEQQQELLKHAMDLAGQNEGEGHLWEALWFKRHGKRL